MKSVKHADGVTNPVRNMGVNRETPTNNFIAHQRFEVASLASVLLKNVLAPASGY